MIVGAYSLDLYCDNDAEPTHHKIGGRLYVGTGQYPDLKELNDQYIGETFLECAKQARADGWKVDRKNDICLCPFCRGKL
jgi:hypothetical protein